MSKKKIIIWTYPLISNPCGGNLVLHTLASRLQEHPLLKHRVIAYDQDTRISTKNQIILYPEIVKGNPGDGSIILRWILYYPHPSIVDSFQDTDIIYYYSKAKGNIPHRECAQLSIIDIPWKLIDHPYAHNRTSDSCYAIRKGVMKNKIHPPDSILIDNRWLRRQVINVFQKCSLFYCYDPYSFLSNLAVLCGCTSIVVPVSGVHREEWIEQRGTYGAVGIAYGIDDIPRALSEAHLARQDLRARQIECDLTVEKFLERVIDL